MIAAVQSERYVVTLRGEVNHINALFEVERTINGHPPRSPAMRLFSHEARQRNADTRRVYAAYEIAHTVADFIAAISFLIGSILFFWPEAETAAIWFFVVGSVFFCLKPTLRFAREIQLWRMGNLDQLADRARE